jgi:imidazolonepropionase-like amidohydrolase
MALAIVGARLIDARSEQPLDGDTLVVGDDGRIASIGRGRAAVPADATVIDAGGATVTPGLIDCHVHFSGRHERLEETLGITYTENVGAMLRAG